ncbi:hypothetical protein [Nocardioides exalbidus]|uniref:hypothetical protein n=1 Tax=Nocardioides exalbidus TaxID=402596 RepID=UPI000B86D362|nr:hypothetical protein [Nocardioides exalbidus]
MNRQGNRLSEVGGSPLVMMLFGVGTGLVVLAQVWRLWDLRALWWLEPINILFTSGRVGATVLAVCAGYTCAVRLLDVRGQGVYAVARAVLGPVIVASLLVTVVTGAVLILGATDSGTRPGAVAEPVLLRPIVGSYWNLWIVDNPVAAPDSLAGLWIISALVQMWLGGCVVLALLARWHRARLVLLGVLVIGSATWRALRTIDGDWFEASLHTWGLVDAFALGILAALVAPHLRSRGEVWAGSVYSAALLSAGGSIIAGNFFTNDARVALLAPTTGLLAAIACMAARCTPDRSLLAVHVASHPRVVAAASSWPGVLVWAQAVVVEIQVRTNDVEPWLRVVVAATVLAGVATMTRALVVDRLAVLASRRGAGGPHEVLLKDSSKPVV